jgi:hypothetical protein
MMIDRGCMRYLLYCFFALSLLGCPHITPAQIPIPKDNIVSVVVLDIDGTLTPKVLDVYSVRPDAAKAMSALSEKGYTVIYVTTRIPLFQSMLPKWLRDNGFPEGILRVAQTDEEREHPEAYKARVLNDYAAYAAAGIPKERVFALKRTGSNNCEKGIYEACLDGWTEHLPYINTVIATKR